MDFLGDLFGAFFGDTEEEIRKTEAALRGRLQRLRNAGQATVDRGRVAELARLAELAYATNGSDLSTTIEALHQGEPPLSRPYNLLQTLHLDDMSFETGLRDALRSYGPRGMVVETADEIVVAVKGSSDAIDWLALNPGMVEPVSAVGHPGFLAFGRTIADQVFKLLGSDPGHRAKRLSFTGHSLGGAGASVAAWLAVRGTQDAPGLGMTTSLFTFGAPHLWIPEKIRRQIEHDIDRRAFATVGDMVAGYPSDVDLPAQYLLADPCRLYALDESADAMLARVYEYALLMHRKENDDNTIRLLMARLRSAAADPARVASDPLLARMTPRRFPRRYFLEEHAIDRYIKLLRCPG